MAFAVAFTSIGWKEINPFAFPDLENYRTGFDSNWFLFQSLNLSPLDFFVSEGVWVRGFDALTSYVGNIDSAFDIVSFISVALIAWYVIAETRSPLYLPLLVNPGFVNLVEEQIRSGLATGIFLLAVRARSPVWCVLLALVAASLHTAFFLFGGVLIFYRLARNLPSYRAIMQRPFVGGATVLIAAAAITWLRTVLLSALGDERAFTVEEYNSGVLLSLAWVLFGAWFALQVRGALFAFEALLLLFCSTLAFISAIQGVYGARFFVIAATTFPVLVSRASPLIRWPTIAAYAVFATVWFILWFQ
uniref:hypothetical protein n=1 Tax=Altererythrobacter segetis TaxID=1104773 RepID=UPI00140E5592|nr:hypothetical protein [Altererythrobacter segetis]